MSKEMFDTDEPKQVDVRRIYIDHAKKLEMVGEGPNADKVLESIMLGLMLMEHMSKLDVIDMKATKEEVRYLMQAVIRIKKSKK